MAVNATIKSIAVSMKLNNGTTDKGALKIASQSLGSLDKTNFDNEKAMNVVNALTPCLSKELVRTEKTTVETLSAA